MHLASLRAVHEIMLEEWRKHWQTGQILSGESGHLQGSASRQSHCGLGD